MHNTAEEIKNLWQQLYEQGGVEYVRKLIELDPSQAVASSHGFSLLHAAATAGDLPLIEVLLQKGASVNVVDAQGQTPLHCAATSRNPAICSLLLDRGAFPQAKDKKGRTPLCNAIVGDPWKSREELEEVVQVLRHAGATLDLNSAILLGDVDYIKSHASTNFSAADIPFPGKALADAVRMCDLEVLTYLLQNAGNEVATQEAVQQAIAVAREHLRCYEGGKSIAESPDRSQIVTDLQSALKMLEQFAERQSHPL